MKIKQLIRRLIIEGIIGGGTLLVLGILAWVFADMVESSEQQRNNLVGQTAVLENQTQVLRSKLGKFEENPDAYKKLFSAEGMEEFALDRDKIRPIFDELQKDYNLEKLRVSIDQIQEMKDGEYNRPNAVALSANGSVAFTSLSDLITVQFLSTLTRKMPAFIKITRISMKRSDSKNVNQLQSQKTHSVPDVENEIQFQWMGLKNMLKIKATPGGPPGMPGMPAPLPGGPPNGPGAAR